MYQQNKPCWKRTSLKRNRTNKHHDRSANNSTSSVAGTILHAKSVASWKPGSLGSPGTRGGSLSILWEPSRDTPAGEGGLGRKTICTCAKLHMYANVHTIGYLPIYAAAHCFHSMLLKFEWIWVNFEWCWVEIEWMLSDVEWNLSDFWVMFEL